MPLMEISRSNRSCSSARGEAVERDHVLAHVRVDAQRDAARPARRGRRTWRAAPARRSRRRRRPRRPGSDASRSACRASRAITAGSRASWSRAAAAAGARGLARGARGGRAAAAIAPCALWTWQIATASASAASCGAGGASRPSSSFTICRTCCFSARPKPTTARLISAGVYSTDRHARLRRGEQRHAARVPELQRAAHVLRVEDVLDRDAVGAVLARAARRDRRGWRGGGLERTSGAAPTARRR